MPFEAMKTEMEESVGLLSCSPEPSSSASVSADGLFRSMAIRDDSKTPYSDATQVYGVLSFIINTEKGIFAPIVLVVVRFHWVQ